MAKKTFGLGRGLESLLPDSGDSGIGIMQIPIGELDPNPDQPRQTFDETTIAQLAASIQDQGFLQPLLVVPTPGGRYRIVAGERRYRAGRKAGVDTIPCIVRDLDVTQQMEIAPMEAARGIDALKTQCGYTQEKIAARLGMSRPAVANMLRLLTLPDEVTEMVRDGLLTAGHARVLAGLNSREDQIRLAHRAADEGMNVRQLEQLAASLKPDRPARKRKAPEMPAELGELQDKIRLKTGLKSTLTGNINKGKIVLQYSTREELERLNDVLDMIQG